MGRQNKASFIICLITILIVSFSGISWAEKTPRQKCLDICAEKRLACFNINADKRACEVEFKSCSKECQKEPDFLPVKPGENASSTQPESRQDNYNSSTPR